jgi:hypothetical protein
VVPQDEVSDGDGTVIRRCQWSVIFKNSQVLQQPVQSCILALLNTSAICGYIEYHGALQFKFKIITWMNNT